MRRTTVAAMLLAGCGRVGFEGVVRTDDSTPDANAVDAASGTVRVIVGRRPIGITPAPDILVWSNRADGALQAMAMTDGDGAATLEVEPGGWVSADLRDETGTITSRVDVQPGDMLYLGEQNALPCVTDGAAQLVFPLLTGSIYFQLAGRCPGQGVIPSKDPFVDADLGVALTPEPFDLTILAYGTAGVLLGSIARPDVTLADGEQLVFGASDWRSPITTVVTVSGVPAGTTSVSSRLELSTGTVRGNAGAALVEVVAPAPNVDLPFSGADVGAERVRVSLDLLRGPSERYSTVITDAPIGPIAIPALPPLPGSVEITPTGSFQWSGTTTGAVDLVQLVTTTNLFVDRSSAAPPTPTWSVLAPPGTQEIVPPELPAGVALPSPISTVRVIVAEDSRLDGWADARTRFDSELPWRGAIDADTYAGDVLVMGVGVLETGD